MSKASFKPSSEQKRVIAHGDGHLQVIACAGSGKTEAISRRVAALVEKGTDPRAIIAFTFTERAAAGLKARITQRIEESMGTAFLDRLGPMFIGTIHAYCLRLLQDHVPEYGNFDVLDENRHAGLLSREYRRLQLNRLGNAHWRPIFDFQQNVDVVENELIDKSKLAGTPFGDCFEKYCETLHRYHFLTYGQLITAAIGALENREIFERVHEPLEHLIVDEYQDINPAQEKLIELLAKPPVDLCVVGDDDQAIYQWRGSDVANILTFQRRYKAKALSLSVNRRSRPGIISAANRFARQIEDRLPKKMKPHRDPAQREMYCWAAETPEHEAEIIADTIESLVNKKGYRYRDIAVLYRSVRTSSPPLIDILRDRDIPFRCAGRTGLFMQPEVAVLGRLYAWLCDNDWKNDRYAQPESVDLDDLVYEFNGVFADGKEIPKLAEYLEDWKGLVDDKSAPVNLVRDYYRLLNLLGVQSLDLDDPQASARMGCLARFSQILADFEHVKRRARYVEENGTPVFRGGQDRGIWFYRQLFNYLQHYALDAYEDFEGEDTFDLDAVDILTVHQAKGLEWPVVFVPCLTHRRFPAGRAGTARDWLIPQSALSQTVRMRYAGGEAEERRLFYVAMTRAKDMLYLSRFRRKTNQFRPSPFLLDVAGDDPDVVDKLPLPPKFQPPADEAEELPTVTFSELALYQDCPLRYRLSSSLGFQPQLATELGYGKTIHHVLRRIADTAREKRRLPTKKEVESLFHEEFYLPFANRAAFEHLLANAKNLVKNYLSEYSDDLLRVWQTERFFELHLDEGIVNGRADVILHNEGGIPDRLAIVDYKTATEAQLDDVFAFQIAIYAAAGRGEGLDVEAGYLHQLKDGIRHRVAVDESATSAARDRANRLITKLVAGNFPANPEKKKCRRCDVRAVCQHAKCGKYEY